MEKIICTNCGHENKIDAKYCSRCGFELPKAKVEIPVQQPATTIHSRRNKIIYVIIGLISFTGTYFVAHQYYFKPDTFDKEMMKVASEINKTCPFMIDKDTRLENAIAMPDNSFEYNYTMIDIDRSDVNPDSLKKHFEPKIINKIKTDPALEPYRENKVTLIYNYRDKNGVFLLKLTVTPDMYE